jgi:rhodanese-related sulfurtransferase
MKGGEMKAGDRKTMNRITESIFLVYTNSNNKGEGYMKRRSYVLFVALMISAIFAFHGSLALAQGMSAKDLVDEAQKSITTISVEEAKALFDKGGVVFLDCREDKEFKSGHIPGAIHISRGLLEFQIDKKIPDKNATVVMYCKTGGRASLACCSIQRMGYKNVKNLKGGWQAWSKAGYPVE